nr:hypothetical protein [Mucilaginibacter sp. L294]
MKYKIHLIAAILSSAVSTTFAQTAKELATKHMVDSLKMAALSDYATRYPFLRQGFLATDITGGRNVKAELNGKDLYAGEMNITRVRASFNIPLAQWGKNTVTGTVSYQQTHFDTHDIQSYSPQFTAKDQSITKNAVGFTASYSHSDSLFNHPVNFGGSISGLTDEFSSIKRINYLGNISVPIKRSQYSSLTVGLVVIIDPSAVAPVVPFISYWHKYKNSDWELFVDLPQRIVVRKQLTKKSWVFLGSELGGSLYFFDLNQPNLPQNAIYSAMEIRSGATFEYLVTKKLVLGVSSGLYSTASPRLFDHNDKPSDYFAKINGGSAPYINFSLSFLPFIKR